MPIDLLSAKSARGHVVHYKRVQGEEELDELVEVESKGGILFFKRGPAVTMSNIERLRVVGPQDVAQLLVDQNAAKGGEHTQDDLYPSAGILCALFPVEFKDTTEAVHFLLTHTPASGTASS